MGIQRNNGDDYKQKLTEDWGFCPLSTETSAFFQGFVWGKFHARAAFRGWD